MDPGPIRLSWQVMFMGDRESNGKITPTLMFVGKQCGKQKRRSFLRVSIPQCEGWPDLRYGANEEPTKQQP